MKKLILLLLFIPLVSFGQTPGDIYRDAKQRVEKSLSNTKTEVIIKEPSIDVYLEYLRSSEITRYSEKFENGEREMRWTDNYPVMNKSTPFNYRLKPTLYKTYTSDNNNSHYFWKDDNSDINIINEFHIGNDSYARLIPYGIHYEEGSKYWSNFKTGANRTGSLSGSSIGLYKFCRSNNCQILLDFFAFDSYDLEFDDQLLWSRPVLVNLDVVNDLLINTNSKNNIHYILNDYKWILKDYAYDARSRGEILDEDLPLGKYHNYKLAFKDSYDPILKKYYKVDNYKFSINKDFELSFSVKGTSGAKANHKVIIALGFGTLSGTRFNTDPVDPEPEPGSQNYHLKFKIEQSTIYRGMVGLSTKVPKYDPDKTYLTVEKYFRGIKIKNEKIQLNRNYLERGEGEVDKFFKINRIGDEIYFSIEGDLVYNTSIKKFENNKFMIENRDIGRAVLQPPISIYVDEKSPDVDVSWTTNVVFSNPINEQKPSLSTNSENWKGNGSGFFIDNKGYIATNFHVVENANQIEITFSDGLKKYDFSAEVTLSDKINDLAILKINDSNFDTVGEIPYSIKVRSSDVGSEVFALGYPMALSGMGEDIKFTDGKISSKSGFNGDLRLYQTSTPIQEGNSGGPLFDSKGNLIGINTAKISSDKADNVSYSIKSSYLTNLMDGLPSNVSIPNNNQLESLPLTEQIKQISKYVVLIKVK